MPTAEHTPGCGRESWLTQVDSSESLGRQTEDSLLLALTSTHSKNKEGAEETAQQLEALTAPPEHLGLIPLYPHDSSQVSVTLVPRDLTSSSGL